MNTNTTITDPRARRWGNFVKYSVLVLGLAVFAPVIWLAVGGLVGLVLFGAIALGTWMLKEPAFTFAANMRLKLIKAEAAKNPVETLQTEHLRQSEILEERKKGIDDLAGAIRTLDQTIDKLQQEFPDSPELPQLREDQAQLETLESSRRADWQQAYISLGEFAKEIQRVSRLWDVSLAAARARQQSGLTNEEWMAKLKTQTSLDAIRTNLNTQLAALKTESMQAEADRILKGKTKTLPSTEKNTITLDVPATAKAV